MPQGLQCWDSNGNMTLDVTDRLTRLLGTAETGVSNGSISDENLSAGTPWFVLRDTSDYEMLTEATCSVTISGNTISWVFSSTGTKTNKKIVYGVY